MCGLLVELFRKRSSGEKETSVFAESLKELKHRGPDSSRIVKSSLGKIGFSRLALFGGEIEGQPLTNEAKSAYLVCNGEIYNHKELREALSPKHSFYTNGDCEPLIHLYEDLGTGFVEKLKGQFAGVIVDERLRQVIAFRDRFGICPLYYYQGQELLIFSSEVKAIATHLKEKLSINHQALVESFALYGPTPPSTLFREVSQIPPGHWAVFNIETGEQYIHRYWTPSTTHETSRSFESLTEEFDHLLKQAVQRRLQANSKPSVYLSGGIDSSAVSWYLKDACSLQMALSIKFDDASLDESTYQELVTQQLDVEGKNVLIQDGSILESLMPSVWHAESPLIRTAPVPMYLLSQVAKAQGYKFVLCGEGADETLAGYSVFLRNKSSIEEKAGNYQELFDVFIDKENLVSPYELATSYASGFREKYSHLSSLSVSQLLECDTKLSRYLLSTQGDRMSMAHSIEQRFPFLDEDLVDFIFARPEYLRIKDYTGKSILRSLMNGRLPNIIVNRSKQGYLAPPIALSHQLLSSYLFDFLDADLAKSCGVFNPSLIAKIRASLLEGKCIGAKQEEVILFILTTHILYKLITQRSDISSHH